MVSGMRDRTRASLGGLIGAVALGAVAMTTPAARAQEAAPSPALDLAIRARSLGLTSEAAPAGDLGLGTMRTPTGAGSSSRSLPPGVSFGVAPATGSPSCRPGDTGLRPSPRR